MRFTHVAVLGVALPAFAWGASPASAASTAHYRHERGWDLNDRHATPGAVLTVSAATVCKVGYSSSVRNVSAATKNRVYAEYGITSHRAYQYEVDHLVSLELGGSNAITNLWPEPNDKKRVNTKDALENHLHALVCAGKLSLATAQNAIATDWVTAYTRYYKPLPVGHNY